MTSYISVFEMGGSQLHDQGLIATVRPARIN